MTDTQMLNHIFSVPTNSFSQGLVDRTPHMPRYGTPCRGTAHQFLPDQGLNPRSITLEASTLTFNLHHRCDKILELSRKYANGL